MPHWNQYTAGLARDAKARKAAATVPAQEPGAVIGPTTDAPLTDEQRRAAADDMTEALAATRARSARRIATPEGGAQGDAG